MASDNEKMVIVPFRSTEGFKKRLRMAAALNGQNVSEYLRERMAPVVSRDIASKRREILKEAA